MDFRNFNSEPRSDRFEEIKIIKSSPHLDTVLRSLPNPSPLGKGGIEFSDISESCWGEVAEQRTER